MSQPWFFVRARLQPCRNWRKINKALAAEGFALEFSYGLYRAPDTKLVPSKKGDETCRFACPSFDIQVEEQEAPFRRQLWQGSTKHRDL